MALVANVVLVALSLLMGLQLLRRYAAKQRQHTLWYAVGLLLTTAAAFPEVYRELTGGLPTILWWLYWSAASATVGFLAAGTAYLISPSVGRIALGAAVTLSLAVVVAAVATAGPAPSVFTETTFAKAPNGYIKAPFLVQNIAGSLMILVGALISFAKTRALYNIWIVLGTFMFAAGGASSGLLAYSELFYFTQTLGIALLFLGVSLSIKPVAAKASAGVPSA